jgi:hypothetical protein
MLERQQGIGRLGPRPSDQRKPSRRGADVLAAIFRRAAAAYQARGKRFALMKGRFSCRRMRRILPHFGAARLNPGYACCIWRPIRVTMLLPVTRMPRRRDARGDGGK